MMKLTDNISEKGLLDLGFETTYDPNIFKYIDFDVRIEVECLNTNGWWNVYIGSTSTDLVQYGIAIDYNGIKSYCSIYNKFDFMDIFKGKFEANSQYETLLTHEEDDNDAMLKWIHYNANTIKQIVSISENRYGCTVWYIPVYGPDPV